MLPLTPPSRRLKGGQCQITTSTSLPPSRVATVAARATRRPRMKHAAPTSAATTAMPTMTPATHRRCVARLLVATIDTFMGLLVERRRAAHVATRADHYFSDGSQRRSCAAALIIKVGGWTQCKHRGRHHEPQQRMARMLHWARLHSTVAVQLQVMKSVGLCGMCHGGTCYAAAAN